MGPYEVTIAVGACVVATGVFTAGKGTEDLGREDTRAFKEWATANIPIHQSTCLFWKDGGPRRPVETTQVAAPVVDSMQAMGTQQVELVKA